MSAFADDLASVHPALVAEAGLAAIPSKDRRVIDVAAPRQLEGSCALDQALAPFFPNAHRWDYAIAYEQGVWFVEVHPASGDGAIAEVVAKAMWLRSLLADTPLWAGNRGLFWVASGRTSAHPAFSRKRRRLAQAGVRGPMGRVQIGS